MFRFWQMIQMGPMIFFKSDISKHRNPSRAYEIRPDEAPVVSRHQGSPPSVALSVMLVDYSLDCKGLKGEGESQWAQEKTAPCGKETYKRTLRVTLADLKATLKQNARAQKDLKHEIKVKYI